MIQCVAWQPLLVVWVVQTVAMDPHVLFVTQKRDPQCALILARMPLAFAMTTLILSVADLQFKARIAHSHVATGTTHNRPQQAWPRKVQATLHVFFIISGRIHGSLESRTMHPGKHTHASLIQEDVSPAQTRNELAQHP